MGIQKVLRGNTKAKQYPHRLQLILTQMCVNLNPNVNQLQKLQQHLFLSWMKSLSRNPEVSAEDVLTWRTCGSTRVLHTELLCLSLLQSEPWAAGGGPANPCCVYTITSMRSVSEPRHNEEALFLVMPSSRYFSLVLNTALKHVVRNFCLLLK